MSFTCAEQISVQANESTKCADGKRVIDSIRIEIASTVETIQYVGTERSDWFKGVSHTMTIDEAETLYLKLGQCLDYLKGLDKDGHILLS